MFRKLIPVASAVFFLMMFVTIFTGCAKPPTQELAQAEKAFAAISWG